MVYKLSTGLQKPTVQPAKRGRPKKTLLADSGRESNSQGRAMSENYIQPIAIVANEIEVQKSDKKNNKIMEKLDFLLGENILSICLICQENKVYRLQIFMNDSTEIRNVTYPGNSSAYAYWNLLKGSMKK